MDGFGEMNGRTHYEGFESRCARCNKTFWFSAAAQKYVHEQRQVPVKRARASGTCEACTKKRGAQNRARAESARIQKGIAAAKAAAAASPRDAGKLLEYAVAKLRALERGGWSQASAQRILGEIRRARRMDPKLKEAGKWEARLREMIAAREG